MKILNFKRKKNGCLIGFCTIEIEVFCNMKINECSIFEKDGKAWFKFPQRQYEKDGEKKYYSYIFFEDKNVAMKMQDSFRHAWAKFIKENPQALESDKDIGFVEDKIPF